jgi:adenylosuccinate lyase
MPVSPLLALSPLDGRYAGKVEALRPLLSEYGLIRCRVRVEVEWFIALSEAGFAELRPFGPEALAFLRRLVERFSRGRRRGDQGDRADHQPRRQGGRVLARRAHRRRSRARPATGFLHFACTSEDINNTSHALMLGAARARCCCRRSTPCSRAAREGGAHAEQPMLSRTHGQTATPTTLGKEFANVAARLARARARIAAVALPAKMNGAVGNYNAHLAAYPGFDWEAFSRRVVEERLGLEFNPLTTQIEPHDGIAELFDAVKRCNTILIDWCRDAWGYISLGYFTQKTKPGEVGSSTMPHKVNPIDFENAEGNFGLANAVLAHLAEKLPVSRFQRDLTDSTVLRNMGVGLGHAVLAPRLARPRHGQARRRSRRRSTPTSTPPGRCSPSRCRR